MCFLSNVGVFLKEKTETRVCIKMNKTFFTEVADLAQKAGIRGKGVFLYTKVHGFDTPNTKGLAKFFRWLVQYYKETEPERIARKAEILAKFNEAKKAVEKEGML